MLPGESRTASCKLCSVPDQGWCWVDVCSCLKGFWATAGQPLTLCVGQSTMEALAGNQFKAVLYILLNVASGTGIVFANKIVLSVYKFHFVYALTLIHTTATMVSKSLS
jgi:hypothetical protein